MKSTCCLRASGLLRLFRLLLCFGLLFLVDMDRTLGDGPADNQAQSVRPIPPPGIAIPAESRMALESSLKELETKIEALRASKDPLINKYLPDVEIFQRAVSIALTEDGFFDAADVDRASAVLKEGLARAEALAFKNPVWRQTRSATVRGFRSKLDGTVQPYGVVMNEFPYDGANRADVWCRGRSEKGLELQFLATRLTQFEPFPEPGVIMIHPFGRYCNANKLAGEIDTLEAIEHAMSEYAIDPNRIAIRGFSMGGAAAWHLAVHYPDRWFAANPGAGFSETPEFLKVFQSETLEPYWFEQKLWQLYDCPVWVRNLRMLPTIAYSGALDKQKQAADIMAQAAWNLPGEARFELTHIVAPNTGHQVAPESRREIERRLTLIDQLKLNRKPEGYSFTTCSLRYNRAHHITIDALTEHWVPTTIREYHTENVISAFADSGVQQFTLSYDVGEISDSSVLVVIFDSTQASGVATPKRYEWNLPLRSDRSFSATFRRTADSWEHVSPLEPPSEEIRKRHGLQGPIDDAFLDAFLFVPPASDGLHPETQRWVQSEFDRAVREWHRQMRGEVRIKKAADVTPDDMKKYHLILWGDPQSNPLIAQFLPKLPLRWSAVSLDIGGKSWDTKSHMPVMIYPNPASPNKYIVLNSSFTYREYDYLNNARQVPKLPDWAVIDLSEPPGTRWPGKIADANFFDEQWQVKPSGPNSSR
ncbi:MAG: prolyl oligopeptidase family serine peptidase [Planctomycetes bacterium]|nr:prolyl oligopeptidase family serine peptidase [Planctomycetota bacterium]